MKIISWNVNSVRARITNILEYIRDTLPDILFLQEIRLSNQALKFHLSDMDSMKNDL